jgi:hypothetical protein
VLAADAGGDDGPLSRDTVSDYLSALERLMVVEDQPAWSPHLRSKAILRAAPKRHFVDPSLAVAAVGGSADRLLADLRYFGFVFESLIVRDLRVLGQPLDAEVYHYRDNTGLEAAAKALGVSVEELSALLPPTVSCKRGLRGAWR